MFLIIALFFETDRVYRHKSWACRWWCCLTSCTQLC